jgi:U3 small nucleolar RNA-associated protein 23
LKLIDAVDSEILQESAQKKIDLVGRLKGVLGGEVKPMVTQCDMRHLYDAETKDEDLILQAKTYERRRCNHHELEKPLSSLECISECVDPKGSNTNKHRYVIATQNPKLRAQMRRIPGVPLVYVNKSVMILEPLAASTEDIREREEKVRKL